MRDHAAPLNGHPITVATNKKQIFFYREDCPLDEGHEAVDIEAGTELKNLVLATFDETLVRSTKRLKTQPIAEAVA